MNVLDMKPGRELDALVAEKVMGLIKDDVDRQMILSTPYYRYSTDISAAMLSIKATMEKAQAHVDIELFYNSALDGRVTVHDIEGREDIIIPYGASLLVKTLPEAICKAALLAVMGDD